MKRRDLIKRIRAYANLNNLPVVETEGGKHTKFTVGNKTTVVARHTEINDHLARAIMKQIEKEGE